MKNYRAFKRFSDPRLTDVIIFWSVPSVCSSVYRCCLSAWRIDMHSENMFPILKLTKKYKIKIIEDCAHAIESKYYNKHVGNFGEAGCFSFYATKNLTTGEGGMLVTNKKKISSRIKIMRLHGMTKDAWKRHLPQAVTDKNKFQHSNFFLYLLILRLLFLIIGLSSMK